MDAFLHRQERKAIEKRRKGEPLLTAMAAYHDGRLGVLAVTPARVLFAARRALRTPVLEWPRRGLQARIERRRYGVLVFGTGARFELTASEDKHKLKGTLLPAERKVDPVKELTRRPKRHREAAKPNPDPLAHRRTPEHEAKLREMYAKGVITKDELEWQLR